VIRVNNVQDTQLGQCLFDGIHPRETGQSFSPQVKVAQPLLSNRHELIRRQLVAPSLGDRKSLAREEIIRILRFMALRDLFEQCRSLLKELRPEFRPHCFPPVIGFVIRSGDGVHLSAGINQPEKAGRQDVSEFLVFGAFRGCERLVAQLPDRAAYRNLACPEMVDGAEPVLVIDSREECVQPLRIYQEGPARNEGLLSAPGPATRVSHHRCVWIFVYLEPDYGIFVKQCRRCTQLLDVKPADVIVEQEHASPAAHTADQHAEVAFPADVQGRR
jgi:hypothetical protein